MLNTNSKINWKDKNLKFGGLSSSSPSLWKEPGSFSILCLSLVPFPSEGWRWLRETWCCVLCPWHGGKCLLGQILLRDNLGVNSRRFPCSHLVGVKEFGFNLRLFMFRLTKNFCNIHWSLGKNSWQATTWAQMQVMSVKNDVCGCVSVPIYIYGVKIWLHGS